MKWGVCKPLGLGPPLRITYITNIEEFHINGVILDINYIFILSWCIRFAPSIGTFNRAYMRKCWIVLGKLIHQDFITLRCLLFQIDFQNETTLSILMLISTIATDSSEGFLYLLGWLVSTLLSHMIQIQIIITLRDKVSFFLRSYSYLLTSFKSMFVFIHGIHYLIHMILFYMYHMYYIISYHTSVFNRIKFDVLKKGCQDVIPCLQLTLITFWKPR